MYKRRELGYNSWAMAATHTNTPGTPGELHARHARGGPRTVAAALFVVVGFIVIDAFVGDRGMAALIRSRQEHAQLAKDVARKQAENERLREQIRRLQGEDPSAIEEIARRELGLIKPGERLFIIRDVPAPDKQ
jgi:cell division protein FtsB